MTFEEGHSYLASSALFFPDGRYLLTAAVDNTARLWDVATGGEANRLDHTGRSAATAMSFDGRWIATGSDDKSVKLWDVKKLLDPKQTQFFKKLEGHLAEVTSIAFSQDNWWLATGDAKGHVKLWSLESGKVVASLEGHTRKISAVLFLPDGSRVLTASLTRPSVNGM